MMIPIASMTVAELQDHAHELIKADELARQPGRLNVHNFAMRLVQEIARLRSIEEQRCKTSWHDHAPQDLTIEPDPPTQLELLELTRMMGPGR